MIGERCHRFPGTRLADQAIPPPAVEVEVTGRSAAQPGRPPCRKRWVRPVTSEQGTGGFGHGICPGILHGVAARPGTAVFGPQAAVRRVASGLGLQRGGVHQRFDRDQPVAVECQKRSSVRVRSRTCAETAGGRDDSSKRLAREMTGRDQQGGRADFRVQAIAAGARSGLDMSVTLDATIRFRSRGDQIQAERPTHTALP